MSLIHFRWEVKKSAEEHASWVRILRQEVYFNCYQKVCPRGGKKTGTGGRWTVTLRPGIVGRGRAALKKKAYTKGRPF